MKINIVITMVLFLFSFFINGQTRSVNGKVISEDLEPLAGVQIRNSDNELLGETDFDGQFKIIISGKNDTLCLDFIGMEFTEIKLKEDCNNVEIIMMYYVIYDFISSKKIDRLRKKRYKKLNEKHLFATDKGIFQYKHSCYIRNFKQLQLD
ncbi:hypothetical protein [Flavobacterium channae]|uniref:hypothetical protein n=1 Tax=Flavobacterium channae TaxID=2897181 RepID=UPI001E2BCDF1|nr:hypothetical protein [Flavobacterium channae]UGS22718.1 hypothetical protein LOS89_08000 [Flavobacterium channae]